MNPDTDASRRTVGLLGATGVGVGAIVGGGILVLAGAAFSATGPSALVAFAINGVIAVLTALSFAEMSAAFPQSGGAYTFAKKVLSVRAAFTVGWVLWFAYIVAGVLYALGFAEYGVALLKQALPDLLGVEAPAWLSGRKAVLTLAVGATAVYTLALIRKNTGGGQFATVGKVVVFCVLIIAGVWALVRQPIAQTGAAMTPFFPQGASGLMEAMGFTFIALQGFDLVAAIAGEVRAPERNIPRAMLLSLGAALAIYLPLLFLVSAVGVTPGQSIVTMSNADPETVMASAVRNYMGPIGYWLVMIAAVLSTLSALQANLLAASRVALTMAQDRTLPRVLERLHASRGTPLMAVYASALSLLVILLMVPSLAAAGAAASLIFLVSFAMAHWTAYLARRRAGGTHLPFKMPAFPLIPVVGGLGCVVMALFQGVAVPAAGAIALVWLGLGVILYFSIFASRAQAMDAFAEANDPDLVRLRGRSPLVLVPIANPQSAPAMVEVANALAPPVVGRVLLLSVMIEPGADWNKDDVPPSLVSAQQAAREALTASLASGHAPEALMTVAPLPWAEISRVARAHGCESLLLGMNRLADSEGPLEGVLNAVDCDVAVLRSAPGWRVESARRILVPIGGRGMQDELRARLLGALRRTGKREVVFLHVHSSSATASEKKEAERAVRRLAQDEAPGALTEARIVESDSPIETIVAHAQDSDLVILGLQRKRGRKLFGQFALQIAEQIDAAAIMLSRN